VGISFFDTHQIRFSPKNYKRFQLFYFSKKTYTPGSGINFFVKLFNSHNVGSHKFENSQSSFGGSRQSVITFFSNK
jgi:hypothetical protein